MKDDVPLSKMLPTTSSGKLFQIWTAALMKVLPVEIVLEVGTARAWHDIERLEWVVLLTMYITYD